ncbi:hypothetical protein V7054_05105, partial [Priestia megaterium]|uniref:GTP pyrophosphokinase n=1 Tax=Priestia megaterium TaxID=1404 RepID=UPI002FFF9D74
MTKILEEYESKKVIYLEYEQKIKDLIEALIKEEGVIIHAIESRVKGKDSLSKKIKKKQDKYTNLNEITDTLGLRIITYFEDDVDKIAGLLRGQFNLDEKNSEDKRMKNEPNVFGYSSLHYILTLKEPRASLPEYARYKEVRFELQIRSILQHAWAEIEHDIGYKAEKEIPKEIRRDFSRIAGLLELADREFIRMRSFLADYTQDIEQQIESNSLELEINKVTLQKFLNSSSEVARIKLAMKDYVNAQAIREEEVSVKDIDLLNFFNIKTIGQLDKLFKANELSIFKFYKEWIEVDREVIDDVGETKTLSKGLPLFYLYYVLIYQNYSKKYLEQYLH